MTTAYVPSDPPDLAFLDALSDSERWRDLGVTHWHLTLTEIGTNDPQRYTGERWARIVAQDYIGTEKDPRTAIVWITEQRARALNKSSDPEVFARRRGWHRREDWQLSAVSSWETLTRQARTPAGGGIAVRDGWSVEIYAHPMTPDRCRSAHRAD